MKPFNLERALAGDPVVTREGCKVCLISVLIPYKKIYGLINNIDSPFYWNLDGKFCIGGSNKEDLFMESKKKKLWIAICTEPDMDGCYEVSRYAFEDKDKLYAFQLLNIDKNELVEIEIEE